MAASRAKKLIASARLSYSIPSAFAIQMTAAESGPPNRPWDTVQFLRLLRRHLCRWCFVLVLSFRASGAAAGSGSNRNRRFAAVIVVPLYRDRQKYASQVV